MFVFGFSKKKGLSIGNLLHCLGAPFEDLVMTLTRTFIQRPSMGSLLRNNTIYLISLFVPFYQLFFVLPSL